MQFDMHAYFEKQIRDKMKLTVQGDYAYSRVSSMQHLEEVIDNFRYKKAFFAVDDTEDGFTFRAGGSFFDRKTIVIYILKQYDRIDMDKQNAALAECRAIYKNVLKKLILDKSRLENEMVYLITDRIAYNEIPGVFANNCTGLFFTIPVNIPTDLSYKAEEWL